MTAPNTHRPLTWTLLGLPSTKPGLVVMALVDRWKSVVDYWSRPHGLDDAEQAMHAARWHVERGEPGEAMAMAVASMCIALDQWREDADIAAWQRGARARWLRDHRNTMDALRGEEVS